MAIQVIETKYKGYRFRSRLEARWAVFFDALGIRWEYEKEGYELSRIIENNGPETVYYLPDFYLPSLNIWVEVKGAEISDEDEIKVSRLAYHTKMSVLVVGDIPQESNLFKRVENVDTYKGYYYVQGSIEGLDLPYYFCECVYCRTIGVKFDANSDRIQCCEKNKQHENEAKYFYGRIGKAYNQARMFRFEHRELGGC
jgi:hypothetical protein